MQTDELCIETRIPKHYATTTQHLCWHHASKKPMHTLVCSNSGQPNTHACTANITSSQAGSASQHPQTAPAPAYCCWLSVSNLSFSAAVSRSHPAPTAAITSNPLFPAAAVYRTAPRLLLLAAVLLLFVMQEASVARGAAATAATSAPPAACCCCYCCWRDVSSTIMPYALHP